MEMRYIVSIVTAMITSLLSSLMSASGNEFPTLETSSADYSFRKITVSSSWRDPYHDVTKRATCCDGVLGYASDNVSLNYPCQLLPCCNKSDTQAVVPIEFALGFRFQCMPRSTIHTMCYSSGSEVRTSNHDPDFIPRACCPGLRFHIELHHWYAALVIKCVSDDDSNS